MRTANRNTGRPLNTQRRRQLDTTAQQAISALSGIDAVRGNRPAAHTRERTETPEQSALVARDSPAPS